LPISICCNTGNYPQRTCIAPVAHPATARASDSATVDHCVRYKFLYCIVLYCIVVV